VSKRGIYRLDDLPLGVRAKAILRRYKFTRAELRRMTDDELKAATDGRIGDRTIPEIRYALTPGRWDKPWSY
jgi:hypothetical protein